MTYQFKDWNGCKIYLSFNREDKPQDIHHVWVICRYQEQWLLTKHSQRGLEFPGGKVEKGETLEEACQREVYEETGGKVKELTYLGWYRVCGKKESFSKAIFYATIDAMDHNDDYLETSGPQLVSEWPSQINQQKEYSFIMKDKVLPLSLSVVKNRQLY
ncbi:RNA deprotection pyrophosphohydrolase [Alkalihalobacillus pseudalcaliphilus]|uniref:RNA deprotection pyrophosphohydrolase n=1 Tax=Alkalihalobacillus pseudalcaliphilus TaxID=79884 RepID=UPI00064DBAAE|nr:nucleoside triphosphatase YtkD [Alkalihalobacillus pseudalcaliphilus]KMK77774.1 7,8-dihydro-8-oxoguanine-triphosphatase [Alkalihalobacillus pseudalcaliphilus]